MKNKRYRFFAWLDTKTEFLVQDLTTDWNFDVKHITPALTETKQIPLEKYSFGQQLTFIMIVSVYLIGKPIDYIYTHFIKGKFSVSK